MNHLIRFWTGGWQHQEITLPGVICGDIEAGPDGFVYFEGCDGHMYRVIPGGTVEQLTTLDEEKVGGDIETAQDESIFYRDVDDNLRRLFFSACSTQPDPEDMPLVPDVVTPDKKGTIENEKPVNFEIFPNPASVSISVCISNEAMSFDISYKVSISHAVFPQRTYDFQNDTADS